jgi:hypothetical protein
MAGGPPVNGTGPVRRVLGQMGRDLPRPQIVDELVSIIVLIAPSVMRRVRDRVSTKASAASCSLPRIAAAEMLPRRGTVASSTMLPAVEDDGKEHL